jgi:hypothetical protein
VETHARGLPLLAHPAQLTARRPTRRPWPPPVRPATVAAALGELHAAGLAAVDDHHQDELTGLWTALPVARDPLLDAVDLHGAHDLHHTYPTWLEDAQPGEGVGSLFSFHLLRLRL